MGRGHADIGLDFQGHKDRRVDLQVIAGLGKALDPGFNPLLEGQGHITPAGRVDGHKNRVPAPGPAESGHSLGHLWVHGGYDRIIRLGNSPFLFALEGGRGQLLDLIHGLGVNTAPGRQRVAHAGHAGPVAGRVRPDQVAQRIGAQVPLAAHADPVIDLNLVIDIRRRQAIFAVTKADQGLALVIGLHGKVRVVAVAI